MTWEWKMLFHLVQQFRIINSFTLYMWQRTCLNLPYLVQLNQSLVRLPHCCKIWTQKSWSWSQTLWSSLDLTRLQTVLCKSGLNRSRSQVRFAYWYEWNQQLPAASRIMNRPGLATKYVAFLIFRQIGPSSGASSCVYFLTRAPETSNQ